MMLMIIIIITIIVIILVRKTHSNERMSYYSPCVTQNKRIDEEGEKLVARFKGP